MREAREVMTELAATGLSPAQMALIMELSACVAADARPSTDQAAERRRAKDRDRKRRGNPQNSAESTDERVSPTPPSEITPIPPLKGGTFPKSTPSQPEKPSASTKQIGAWVGEIWDITPSAARARTSKADIERALKSALRRDHTAEDVIAGVAAYFDSPDATKDGGKFARGTHRIIENDRWQAFEPELKAPTVEINPWPKRLTAYRINGYWHSDWGPKPGKPDCTVPTEALMSAGYQPPPAPVASTERQKAQA